MFLSDNAPDAGLWLDCCQRCSDVVAYAASVQQFVRRLVYERVTSGLKCKRRKTETSLKQPRAQMPTSALQFVNVSFLCSQTNWGTDGEL